MRTPATYSPIIAPGRDEGGYTFLELIVVMSIVGLLSSLATAGFGHFSNKAKEAVLPSLARLLKIEVDFHIEEFDLAHRYVDRNYDPGYLNGRLEIALEKSAGNNIFDHRNPFSRAGTVLNWTAIPLSVENPAIFITDNENYAFDALPNDAVRPELRGSVVIHLRNNVRQIDIFYFDLSAKKSAFHLVSDRNL